MSGFSRGLFLRLDLSAQNRIHARQMSFSVRFEPFDDIAVEAQMHRSLASRHDDPSLPPEFIAERFRFGRIGPRSILPPRTLCFDLAK